MKQENLLEKAHNELMAYTLDHARRDPSFLHQIAADAWAAQHANGKSKKIGVAFALIGLYLHIEKGFNGKQVQKAHIYLARKRKIWPAFELPPSRGDITVFNVMNLPPGQMRDKMIEEWCHSVWGAWKNSHGSIAQLVNDEMDA